MRFRKLAAALLALALLVPAMPARPSTGTLAPQGWQTFFTVSGDIAAFHKLFTYAAGTSTKQTTYSDAALTVANANPIVLDSAGRCVIFLPQGQSFKFVLAPSTDSDPPVSPIQSQDNIAAVPLQPSYSRKTSDQTFTTTTLGDVTGLSFAVAANEVWAFEAIIHGNAPVAADWKFTVTGPAAPSGVRFGLVAVGAAGATGIGAQSASAFSTAIQVESDGQEETIVIKGFVRNGSNAGTIQIQAAQFAASGTSTIRADSIIITTRFA